MTAPSDQARAELERVVAQHPCRRSLSLGEVMSTGGLALVARLPCLHPECIVAAILDPSNRDKVLGAMGVEAGSDPLRAIANALFAVHEGYTVEDIELVGGPSEWDADNPQDREDEAMYLGHAKQVVAHLLAAGWLPPDPTSPKEHDG